MDLNAFEKKSYTALCPLAWDASAAEMRAGAAQSQNTQAYFFC